MTIRKILSAILAVLFVVAADRADADMQTIVNVTPDGIAIGGWDTVAYFTDNRAVAGSSEFSHEWQEATWLFSSAEHRDLFAADPEAYAPQFGGWCAYALSQGEYAAEVDPEAAWTVHEDQLFLNWDEGVRKKWTRDGIEDGIDVGRENWVEVEHQILEGTARYSRKSDSPWKNL